MDSGIEDDERGKMVLCRLERISTRTDVKKYSDEFDRYEYHITEYVCLEGLDEDLETSS